MAGLNRRRANPLRFARAIPVFRAFAGARVVAADVEELYPAEQFGQVDLPVQGTVITGRTQWIRRF